jgi:hypothetical protein
MPIEKVGAFAIQTRKELMGHEEGLCAHFAIFSRDVYSAQGRSPHWDVQILSAMFSVSYSGCYHISQLQITDRVHMRLDELRPTRIPALFSPTVRPKPNPV